MMDIAREAMPNVPIAESTWIHEYDNYYRSRPQSQPLPVLRVRTRTPPAPGSISTRTAARSPCARKKHNRVRRCTTLVPAFRRLRRHALRGKRSLG